MLYRVCPRQYVSVYTYLSSFSIIAIFVVTAIDNRTAPRPLSEFYCSWTLEKNLNHFKLWTVSFLNTSLTTLAYDFNRNESSACVLSNILKHFYRFRIRIFFLLNKSFSLTVIRVANHITSLCIYKSASCTRLACMQVIVIITFDSKVSRIL